MNEKMTFAGAISTCFKKYANFRGVASRREYWFFILFIVLASIVIGTLDQIFFPDLAKVAMDSTDALVNTFTAEPEVMHWDLFGKAIFDSALATPISNILGLAILVPYYAVLVRRMRDAGFGKWWLLLVWLQLFTFIVTLLPSKPQKTSN